MDLYQYYNTDLLDIPKHEGEDTKAYVDNTIMIATDMDFNDFNWAHHKLEDQMCRAEGVESWSRTHSSPLVEYSKLALINFGQKHKDMGDPTLSLPTKNDPPDE
jgi:hypothetical protein